MKHFYAFLQKQNLAPVESVVCSVDVFQRFAYYLVHEVESGDDNLQVGTCSTYLSAAKEFVKSKFPLNPIWKDHDTERGGKNSGGGK
jgi:hypothetical protein